MRLPRRGRIRRVLEHRIRIPSWPIRPRIRRVLKWAGLTVCALMLTAWAMNLRWGFGVRSGRWGLTARAGRLSVSWDTTGLSSPVSTDWWTFRASPNRWYYGFVWPLSFEMPQKGIRVVWLPCCLPLIVAASPTVVLWYHDRRRIPPGHCQSCGYNLTGNVSGVCSECGTAVGGACPGKG
jgi:hypothetical protein